MASTSHYRGSLQAKIWRYMDFTKFVAMLDQGSLFFSRLDLLDDPFEGSLPRKYREREAQHRDAAILKQLKSGTFLKTDSHKDKDAEPAVGQVFDWWLAHRNDAPPSDPPERLLRAWIAGWDGFRHMQRKLCNVNCWCRGEHESAALWKVFCPDNHGIAVQSTVEKFATSTEHYKDNPVVIGDVQYIDYSTDDVIRDESAKLGLYLLKRKSFEYESEIRGIILDLEGLKSVQTHPMRGVEPTIPGIQVPVDLDVLIERVFIHPFSPTWQSDLVASVLAKYGLADKEVIKSSLAESPIY